MLITTHQPATYRYRIDHTPGFRTDLVVERLDDGEWIEVPGSRAEFPALIVAQDYCRSMLRVHKASGAFSETRDEAGNLRLTSQSVTI